MTESLKQGRKKPESLKQGVGKAGIFKTMKEKGWNL